MSYGEIEAAKRPAPAKTVNLGAVESMAVVLQTTVIAIRRAARRLARHNVPALPISETELLTLVAETKGIGVKEAGRVLQISPNTVSTLVRSLVRRGLLERLSDPSDRRAALLHLTGAGSARKEKVRRQMAKAMTNALLSLSDKDRRALEAALPAMQRLLAELEQADPGKANGKD
jgi:DNA-binding MarR family transcriptional regulator